MGFLARISPKALRPLGVQDVRTQLAYLKRRRPLRQVKRQQLPCDVTVIERYVQRSSILER